MPSDLPFLPISELAPLIRRKKVSPVELVEVYLGRIHALNGALNAFVTLGEEAAMQAARAAEREIAAGSWRGPLHGIPVSVKDNIATNGLRTTCGSKVLIDWLPDYDATAIMRLRKAGALVLGKTNLDEWARGGVTTNPVFGATNNPWDLTCTPGGSSGGAAAAVAAGLCAASLGTDSGGSIRNPAALCGVVGLKPTCGRVSRYGQQGFIWSMDHIGPITRSVRDAAIMLRAMAGYDARDAATVRRRVPDYEQGLETSVRGLRVGFPREPFYPYTAAEVDGAFQEALRTLEKLGMKVVPVALPAARAEHSYPVQRTIGQAETAAYFCRHFGDRLEDLGLELRGVITSGKAVTAVDYLNAQRERRLIITEFEDALRQVDVVATPTRVTAFQLRAECATRTVTIDRRSVPTIPASVAYTHIYDLTGMPAISIPCAFSASGFPIGLQIAGKPFEEATVLRIAYAYEQNTDWHLQRPVMNG